jgi:hypothetical protein
MVSAMMATGVATGGEDVRLRKEGIERSHRLPFGQNERIVVPHPSKFQKDENLGA